VVDGKAALHAKCLVPTVQNKENVDNCWYECMLILYVSNVQLTPLLRQQQLPANSAVC
jgi:hypothetical protein